MEYYTIFIPVQYEVDEDIPVQYEVDADIPVQYEVDADIPVQYEVDADIPVQDEVDADIPVQYEVDADIPVQYEVDDQMAKCCIYTVPEFIKKGKEECYQPYVISIGPIFYKDSKLEAMEELKNIYLQCFLEDQSVEHYKNFVRMNESKIRKCYQKKISIPSEEFIHMIVVDAAFLIYLFVRGWPSSSSSDQTELHTVSDKLKSLKKYVTEDVLYVEENQLPFFVLTHMYDMAYTENNPSASPFINFALNYIGRYHHFLKEKDVDRIITDLQSELPYASRTEHLLDLQRECCLTITGRKTMPKKGSRNYYYPKIPKAKELRAAGVKFEVSKSNDLCDIKFYKSSGVLKMPQLRLLHRSSEAFFRGILFFEQCSHHKRKYITDYCTFLDELIDTVEDIQVLQHKKIFKNYLASDQDAVDLFNKLAQNAFFASKRISFYDVCEELNDYTSDRWNRWKAILWKDYLNHPWAIISVVYAIILLFLTLLQTISGFSSK